MIKVYIEGPFIGEHAFANFQTESGNWVYLSECLRMENKARHHLTVLRLRLTWRTVQMVLRKLIKSGQSLPTCVIEDSHTYFRVAWRVTHKIKEKECQ